MENNKINTTITSSEAICNRLEGVVDGIAYSVDKSIADRFSMEFGLDIIKEITQALKEHKKTIESNYNEDKSVTR